MPYDLEICHMETPTKRTQLPTVADFQVNARFLTTQVLAACWNNAPPLPLNFTEHFSDVLLSPPTHQNMPDVLVGSLEAAEADADSEQSLAAPHVGRHDLQLADPLRLAAVDQHLGLLLHLLV